jgi:hypothetical protein
MIRRKLAPLAAALLLACSTPSPARLSLPADLVDDPTDMGCEMAWEYVREYMLGNDLEVVEITNKAWIPMPRIVALADVEAE